MTETQTAPEAPTEDPVQEAKDSAAEALGLPTDEERAPRKVRTADELKARALHRDVYLPSGAIVDLRIPNLGKLLKSGAIPNDLVDAALSHQERDKVTRETILDTWDYSRFIITQTLAEPVVTEEDVEDMDMLDIELLVNIASRRTDTDAIGRQLGGLDTQESFRAFRAEQSLRATLGGL